MNTNEDGPEISFHFRQSNSLKGEHSPERSSRRLRFLIRVHWCSFVVSDRIDTAKSWEIKKGIFRFPGRDKPKLINSEINVFEFLSFGFAW